MRIILSGGGTGGHIYPAIAIGQALKKEWPQAEILYLGTEKGLERQIIPQTGFAFRTIEIMGWQRKVSLQMIKAGLKVFKGLRQASRIMKEFSPDLVIGTGGYVCLPVVWAASRRKIPTILHEQNALPGITNKFLSRKVDYLLITFPEAAAHFPAAVQARIRVTGLPIRPRILAVSREEALNFFGLAGDKPVLLVSGGSRGARSLNSAMIVVYKRAKELNFPFSIIHLTGQEGLAEVQRELAQAGLEEEDYVNIIIKPYLHEMEYALACADLCIGRAGATFLAEITAKGLPGILVPYPYATENHQEYNARSLEKRGAAKVILDKDLRDKESLLAEQLMEIITDKEKLRELASCSLQAGKPDAVEKILKVVRKVINQ